LPEIRENYVGDPARYFHGVARHVIQEARRPKEIAMEVALVAWIKKTSVSDAAECLRRCLQFLTPEKRALILDYHVYQGHDKIETHKIMAAELDISKGALRLRVHHIRTDLEECVQKCLENLKKQTKGVVEA
jgi:DNA-directed RNA polymerase specialized sigma24 family protein